MQAVTITQITYHELETLIENSLRRILKDYLHENNAISEDKLWMTRYEVSKMFNISLPTLNKWTKEKKINGYKLAGSTRVRYKKSEILNSLKDFQNQ